MWRGMSQLATSLICCLGLAVGTGRRDRSSAGPGLHGSSGLDFAASEKAEAIKVFGSALRGMLRLIAKFVGLPGNASRFEIEKRVWRLVNEFTGALERSGLYSGEEQEDDVLETPPEDFRRDCKARYRGRDAQEMTGQESESYAVLVRLADSVLGEEGVYVLYRSYSDLEREFSKRTDEYFWLVGLASGRRSADTGGCDSSELMDYERMLNECLTGTNAVSRLDGTEQKSYEKVLGECVRLKEGLEKKIRGCMGLAEDEAFNYLETLTYFSRLCSDFKDALEDSGLYPAFLSKEEKYATVLGMSPENFRRDCEERYRRRGSADAMECYEVLVRLSGNVLGKESLNSLVRHYLPLVRQEKDIRRVIASLNRLRAMSQAMAGSRASF